MREVLLENCSAIGCRCGSGISLVPADEHPSLLHLVGTTASCGHCRAVVYPDVHVIREHDFRCESGVAVWHSRAMGVEVHRCDQPSAEASEQSFVDLSTPAYA